VVTFYLFRHGETDWNAEGRFQGHLDIPLNDRGREQARQLSGPLGPKKIQAILSSDLSRSVETASILAREIGLGADRLFQDAGVREAFLGDAQGMTVDEIGTRFGPDILSRWKSSHVTDADISYPNGETGREVVVRSLEAMSRFAEEHPEFERIGISTHGGVIRRVMHQILRDRGVTHPPHIAIPNGVIYRIEFERDTNTWRSPDL
jgi:probable phosphoglycerate mutase